MEERGKCICPRRYFESQVPTVVPAADRALGGIRDEVHGDLKLRVMARARKLTRELLQCPLLLCNSLRERNQRLLLPLHELQNAGSEVIDDLPLNRGLICGKMPCI